MREGVVREREREKGYEDVAVGESVDLLVSWRLRLRLLLLLLL